MGGCDRKREPEIARSTCPREQTHRKELRPRLELHVLLAVNVEARDGRYDGGSARAHDLLHVAGGSENRGLDVLLGVDVHCTPLGVDHCIWKWEQRKYEQEVTKRLGERGSSTGRRKEGRRQREERRVSHARWR